MLDGVVTPSERFYVRGRFPTPELDAKAWRLKVEGAVEAPFELTYGELLALPSETATVTMECAGNARAFLEPKVKGIQWELGAAGTADWTGVPLAAVLDRAGVHPGAAEVVLEGADEGEVGEEPCPAGRIRFARSLPLDRARRGGVLLAYRMNGRELPRAHGFPLRAVVPGWYGMAWVKWLARVIVTDRPFHGYYQTVDYAYWERRDGLPPVRVPITEVLVKAQIARPAVHEVVPRGGVYRVFGAAWAGDAGVAAVEVSTDGGRRYAAAALLGQPTPHAWRLWEYAWAVPDRPGRYTLMARATDGHGRTQPDGRDCDCGTYLISHVLPIDVEVR